MMFPVICRGKASKHIVLFFNETEGIMIKPTNGSEKQGDKFNAAWPCTDSEVWEVVVVLGGL